MSEPVAGQRRPLRRRPSGVAATAAFGLALLVLASSTESAAGAGLPEHPAIEHGPPASWVEPAGPLKPAPDGASAVAYRLVDDQVLADGATSAVFTRRVVEALSPQGLQEAAQWEVELDPRYQRVRLHALEVFRDGSWTDRLASSQMSLLQRERDLGRQIYDETLTLLMVIEDVRVGDLVRVAYTVGGANPILGDRYAGNFLLGWHVPVGEHRLRVVAPAGRPLFYRLHGGADEPREGRPAGGAVELNWRRSGLSAVKSESNLPAGVVGIPYVQLSQFTTWAEVAAWGSALYPAEALPPAMAQVAREILAAHPDDPGARLVAASRWVQDEVRYFAIALGPHSHAPHDLAEISRRRFGDCKDKSRLLVGLLEAIGVEAWPALVDADFGEAVADLHPSPLAFDHVIVAARLGEKVVWIDATLTLQGGAAHDLWVPAYGVALELRPGVDSLTEIPPEQSRSGVREVRYDYRLDAAAEPFEVEIESTFQGAEAESQRRTLASLSIDELQDLFTEFYADGERTVEPLAPLAVIDDRDANRLVLKERYRVLGCWRPVDADLHCDLLPLTLAGSLAEPATVERRLPFAVPRNLHAREIISIQSTIDWDFEPVDQVESTPWFDFAVSSNRGERAIELVYELETTRQAVAPEDIARYARSLRAMNGLVGYSLQVPKSLVAAPPATDDEAWMPLVAFLGCAMVVLPPLLFIAGGVVLIVLARRRRRALAAAPAPSDKATEEAPACRRCGGALPAGSRFCAACGERLAAPPRLSGLARPAVLTGIALACGLGLILYLGVLAAVLIPNFIDALGTARQRRTLADMAEVAAALEAHHGATGSYPVATDPADLGTVLRDVEAFLESDTKDGWQRPFLYQCPPRSAGGGGCDDYRLASTGSDGELEHPDLALYGEGDLEEGDFERDLVRGPSRVIQGPAER